MRVLSDGIKTQAERDVRALVHKLIRQFVRAELRHLAFELQVDNITQSVKVNLGDLFYASTGDYGQNMAYRNRLARKHLDFLLCDPETVRPLLGIELDDSSHNRSDRKERDRFVDGVFAAARLPLVHVPVSHSYPTKKLRAFLRQKAGMENRVATSAVEEIEREETAVPNCPQCQAPMILRTAQKGSNMGNQFWGCAQYPRCRGIRQADLAVIETPVAPDHE